MKSFFIIILCFFGVNCSFAQDTAITLSPAMFTGVGEITICTMDGWYFKEGHDTAWAQKEIDITNWKKLKPTELTAKQADKNGRLEGWLRFKFKLDDAFNNEQPGYFFNGWAAADIYIDGVFIKSFGNTGADNKPFKEYNPLDQLPFFVNLQPGIEHTIAIHFADYVSSFPPFKLMSHFNLHRLLLLTGPEFYKYDLKRINQASVYKTIWVSVSTVLTLLFWFLAFLNRRERNLLLFAICSTLITSAIYLNNFFYSNENSFVASVLYFWAFRMVYTLAGAMSIVVVAQVFKNKISIKLKIILAAYIIAGVFQVLFNNKALLVILSLVPVIVYTWFIVSSWKTLKGAQWAIVGGIFVSMSLSSLVFILYVKFKTDFFPGNRLMTTGSILSFPLSMLVYVALRVKEIIRDVQQNAQKVMQLSEEKKEQALKQQKLLEEEVARQTKELRTSFENLKATQSQLIQSEKMASLGELTAGIAHEIQNPLNFVNNFSELNRELLQELDQEIKGGNVEGAKTITKDVIENEERINFHGKRADSIVKSMLQHSQKSSGQKELTDINALCDEYIRLAYHGFVAKDKSCRAGFKTHLDPSLPQINTARQDISRAILNLINNAFYAVNEKSKQFLEGYEPGLIISTRRVTEGDREGGKAGVAISIKDNGNGIPRAVRDKIFQPFFTTKPTGEGTGLGLSLTYDIIKTHGGEISVESEEGEGSEFTVFLPA